MTARRRDLSPRIVIIFDNKLNEATTAESGTASRIPRINDTSAVLAEPSALCIGPAAVQADPDRGSGRRPYRHAQLIQNGILVGKLFNSSKDLEGTARF